MSGNTSEAALSDSILQTSHFTTNNNNPTELLNQDISGFENMFNSHGGQNYDGRTAQNRVNGANPRAEGGAQGANMMLNFDYSSIFDNKEALHNNSIISGMHGAGQIASGLESGQLSSRYGGGKGLPLNMDDSYMSTSSLGDQHIPQGITAKDVVFTQPSNCSTSTLFKSQGIKQLLSQTPSTGGPISQSIQLSFNYDQALTSKQAASNADLLIEQSRKRIQDITELMKPPSEVMSAHHLQHNLSKATNASQKDTTSVGASQFKATSEQMIEKSMKAQKTTKGMETELKSLQDKIFDLENKLNVSCQPALPSKTKGDQIDANSKAHLSNSSSHSSLDGHSTFLHQQSHPHFPRPDSILTNKVGGIASDRRVTIKETRDHHRGQQLPSSKDFTKKKLRVDIDLNNLSSTHHIEGGSTLSSQEDERKGPKRQGSKSTSSKVKRGSCSPQIKRGMSNKVGQKAMDRGQKATPEMGIEKKASKLDVSVTSYQSKVKEQAQKRPATSRATESSAQSSSRKENIPTLSKRLQSPSSSTSSKLGLAKRPSSQSRLYTSNHQPTRSAVLAKNQSVVISQAKPQQTQQPLRDITTSILNGQPSIKESQAVHSNYKEIASKVVDLQRQLMSLRSKLKQKEAVEEENERLKAELNEFRARAIEHEKKKAKYKAEAGETRAQVEALQKENKGLKEEIGELIFGNHKDFKKKKAAGQANGKKPMK